MVPGASKLNEYQVKQIKELFEITNLNNGEIARMFNVSRTHISLIRSGKRWNTTERSYLSKVEIELDL